MTGLTNLIEKLMCMRYELLRAIESFPPLPESITELNRLCSFEDIDLKGVIRIIESDPLLYADILRFSNVPHYGFRNPITSVTHAIALFGIAAIRGMALTAALKAHPFRDVSAYGITTDAWFAVMEKQQIFINFWLSKKHRHLLQSLGGLPFILEIGRLIAAYVMHETQTEHRFESTDPFELTAEECSVIGESGDNLALELFRHWRFDASFIDSLEHSLHPDNGAEPRMCAALQCARTLFTLKETRPFDTVRPLLETYGFDSDDAQIAYDMVSLNLRRAD